MDAASETRRETGPPIGEMLLSGSAPGALETAARPPRRRRTRRFRASAHSWLSHLGLKSGDPLERFEEQVGAAALGIHAGLWCVEEISMGERALLAGAMREEPRLARALERGLLVRLDRDERIEFVVKLCGGLESAELTEAAVDAIAAQIRYSAAVGPADIATLTERSQTGRGEG